MWAIEIFTEAVSSNDLSRAAKLAEVMSEAAKMVAREIWFRWVSNDCPF